MKRARPYGLLQWSLRVFTATMLSLVLRDVLHVRLLVERLDARLQLIEQALTAQRRAPTERYATRHQPADGAR
jgi:hypothetical protein